MQEQVIFITYQLVAKHLRKLSSTDLTGAKLSSDDIRSIWRQGFSYGIWTADKETGLHSGPGVASGAAVALIKDAKS
eukprot:scaffold500347_cov48-Prasinocladus_malaysianus.AAC.1